MAFVIAQSGETVAGGRVGKVLGTTSTEHPDWFKESFLEIAEDVAEAAEGGKHVLLYFYINDCPYCHKMVEENFKSSNYSDFLRERFDIIALNVFGDREVAIDENTHVSEKALARQLKVRYTPTILFLDYQNKPVLRLNGYRSVQAFKYALDFVNEKAYARTSLSRYIEEREKRQLYVFRPHEQLVELTDLSAVADKPLAVLFEDRTCDECDALHDEILNRAETKDILQRFTFVRFDAFSEQPITDVAGNKTTPKAYAEALGLTYRPGIVLFDRGKEITRIDGMLKTYYFQEVLRYVGERRYEQYPQLRDYLAARTQTILESGQDIDIWK
jgi:thioredoxin-related protein